jgi:hypothetical protein
MIRLVEELRWELESICRRHRRSAGRCLVPLPTNTLTRQGLV